MPADTIPTRILRQAELRPESPAYYAKEGTEWVPTTWKQYVRDLRQAARAQMALGLEPGGTVCILGFNRPEWLTFDVACMLAGGAPAGIYTTCSPAEVAYIIEHAASALVLVENHAQWEKVKEERDKGNLPGLKHVVMMKGARKVGDPMVSSWEEFMARGDETPDDALDARIEGLKLDQLATFIYTSGTTGPPKGVMLSHENLAWTASCAVGMVGARADDCAVSYLPLSHIAEQMFSIHVPATCGYPIFFAESLDLLPDNLREVQPTVVFGVPRIWEKFHAGVSNKLALASGVKKHLVDFALRAGHDACHARNRGQRLGLRLSLRHKIADALIFSKVKPAIGLGRARICVSGAAPIGPEVLEFFTGLDLTIHEVYGQSEGSGPTTFNLPGKTRLGSVGPPIPGCEVKIAEDGEILAKGPNIFLGYYKDKAATDDCLKDGWLYSGDLGAFDDEGFLRITGRKKEIIITAGGKNIAPKNIEAALKNLPLVSQAVVIGDRRKFLSALLTLDEAAADEFREAHNLSGTLHDHPQVIAELQRGVDEEVNKLFAQVEHVRKFTVLPRDFTVDDGELTPTLKIKRRIIDANWAEAIEAMYSGKAPEGEG